MRSKTIWNLGVWTVVAPAVLMATATPKAKAMDPATIAVATPSGVDIIIKLTRLDIPTPPPPALAPRK